MRIDILTLFPEMFTGVLGSSMIKIAREKGIVNIDVHDLRDWTTDRHRSADDKPYGGGPGMVLKVEPVDRALADLKDGDGEGSFTIMLSPQGETFCQRTAAELSLKERIILICGHYEGFDERIRSMVDMEISVGDYVLTCGEIPAMIVCDAAVRLIPGVLGSCDCLLDESFENDLLEYPQYTRPAEYKGMRVPEILLSGDPVKINEWQKERALERTLSRRPDLIAGKDISGTGKRQNAK